MPAALPPAPVPHSPRALPAADSEPTREAHDVWSSVCDQFALRILGLAESMRHQLDKVEANEQDPDKLDELYRLDHAATRVQRLAENLHVIAGRRGGDLNGQRTSLLDVIRGAMSAIEHYSRIEIRAVISLAVAEWAADDVSRLLAEVLDNATRYSPPTAMVTVSAHLTDQGNVLLRIEDSGIGLDSARLAAFNAQLAGDVPALDRRAVANMGMAVIHRLANLHGINVQLVGRESFGTTVLVLLPARLLCEVPTPGPRQPALAHSTTASGVPATHNVPARGFPSHAMEPAPYARPTPDRPTPAEGAPPPRNGQPFPPPTIGESAAAESALPRRQSVSIRKTAETPLPPLPPVPAPPPPADETAERPAWQDDLVAFTSGDEAARKPGPAREVFRPADPPRPAELFAAPEPPRAAELFPSAERFRPAEPLPPPLPAREPEQIPADEHETSEHPTAALQLPPRRGLPGESAAEGRTQP